MLASEIPLRIENGVYDMDIPDTMVLILCEVAVEEW